jgi:hypothetical protein
MGKGEIGEKEEEFEAGEAPLPIMRLSKLYCCTPA